MSNHKEIYKNHTTVPPRDSTITRGDSRSSPSKSQKSSPSKSNLRIKSPTKSSSPHKFINHVSSSNFSPSRYSDSNTSLTSNNSPSKSEQICNRINLAQQTRKTEKLQNELETVLMRVELHQSKFYTTFDYSSDEEDLSDLENSPLRSSETTKSPKTKKSAEQTKELTDEYIAKFFHNSAHLMKTLYQILDSNEYALIDENDELVQVPDAESESKEKQQRRDSYRNNITDLNKLESQLAKLKKLGDDLLTRAANSTGTKSKTKSKKLSEELQKFWKVVEKFSEKTGEKPGKKTEKADKSENAQDYSVPDEFLENNSNLILDECMRFCEDVSETHGYKFKKNAGLMANKLLPSCKRMFLDNIQTVNENAKIIEQLRMDLKISDSKNRKLESSLTEIQRSWKQDKSELFQKTVENDILKGKLSDGYSEISDLKSEIMNLKECMELNDGGGDDSGLRSQLEEIENRRVLERENFMSELKAKEKEFDEFRDRMEKVLGEQEVEIVEIKEGTGLELIERTKVIDTLKSKILELEKFIPDGLKTGTTLLKTVCTSIDSILNMDRREDISEKATSVQSFFELINMSHKNSKNISRQSSSLDQLLSGLSSQDIPNGWSFGKYKSEMEGKMSEQGAMIELLERIYSQYFESFKIVKERLQKMRMDVVNFNIPGGSRQAPYFKGTMIELNQSYELEQVVKQRVDVLEILGELGINIAKNRKKLTGFEKKLRGAEEEYEKKFTKQQLLLDAKLHEVREKCSTEIAESKKSAERYQTAFNAIVTECQNKEDQYMDYIEKLRSEFTAEQSRTKTLETINQQLMGKLSEISGQKRRYLGKYENSKYDNFELKHHLLGLINENKRLNTIGDQINNEIVRTKSTQELYNNQNSYNNQNQQQHQNLANGLRMSLLSDQKPEIVARFNEKFGENRNSRRFEDSDRDLKPTSSVIINNTRSIDGFFKDKEMTKENMPKYHSDTYLLRKRSSDNLKSVENNRDNLIKQNQSRYRAPRITVKLRQPELRQPEPDIAKYVVPESMGRKNRMYQLPKGIRNNSTRENQLATPVAPKLLDIDVNRNMRESLKNLST